MYIIRRKNFLRSAEGPMAAKHNVKTLEQLNERERNYYDMLIRQRDIVMGKMQIHAEDALDCSNADKRGVTTHMADMGSDSARYEMELKLMSEDGDVLALIDDAIERIFTGEFGKCLDCGGQIPDGRLNIRPYAIYCVKCKTKRERERNF